MAQHKRHLCQVGRHPHGHRMNPHSMHRCPTCDRKCPC